MLLYASAKQCEIPTVTINTKFETCCFTVYLFICCSFHAHCCQNNTLSMFTSYKHTISKITIVYTCKYIDI